MSLTLSSEWFIIIIIIIIIIIKPMSCILQAESLPF
jgi:hypothetical protein